MSFEQLHHGERVLLRSGDTYTFSCCTCGLAHSVQFGIQSDTVLSATIYLDMKSTKSRRRGKLIRERIKEIAE